MFVTELFEASAHSIPVRALAAAYQAAAQRSSFATLRTSSPAALGLVRSLATTLEGASTLSKESSESHPPRTRTELSARAAVKRTIAGLDPHARLLMGGAPSLKFIDVFFMIVIPLSIQADGEYQRRQWWHRRVFLRFPISTERIAGIHHLRIVVWPFLPLSPEHREIARTERDRTTI